MWRCRAEAVVMRTRREVVRFIRAVEIKASKEPMSRKKLSARTNCINRFVSDSKGREVPGEKGKQCKARVGSRDGGDRRPLPSLPRPHPIIASSPATVKWTVKNIASWHISVSLLEKFEWLDRSKINNIITNLQGVCTLHSAWWIRNVISLSCCLCCCNTIWGFIASRLMYNGNFTATLRCLHRTHVSVSILILIRAGFITFPAPRDSH